MEEHVIDGDLTRGKVNTTILRFVMPLLVANLLQQSYYIVDSILVGNFLGKEALAAISASFFLYFFIVSLVLGVGSGVSVIISQLCGAQQYARLQSAFSSILIFNLFAGLLLSAAALLLAEPLFRIIQTPPEVIPQALRFFNVYLGGLFIFIIFNSIISVLRGMGDAKRPLVFIGMASVLNILLDALFIIVLKQGVASAAWASLVAQLIAALIALRHLNRRHPFLSLRIKDMHFDCHLFLQGVKIGTPTGVQHCSLALGLLALLGIVNAFGADTLTAYGAAGKVDSLISQVIITLSSALAAFCGQNIGAGALARARLGVSFALRINAAFAITVLLLVCFLRRSIMLLFTPDTHVADLGQGFLLVVGACCLLNGATLILNGAMRGAGKTLLPMLVSIVSLWLVRLPLAWLLGDRLGIDGVWLAIAASIAVAFVFTLLYYKYEQKVLAIP
jgi:putative MATE family efflux protein